MAHAASHAFDGIRSRVNLAAAQLWWLRPAPLVFFVVIPLYLSFLGFDYENVVPRRYVPNEHYYWGFVLLVALALGAIAGTGARGHDLAAEMEWHRRELRIPGWITGALLVLTVFAYIVWFGPLVFEPRIVFDVFRGVRDNVRDVVQTQPGVTTLTQCGVAFIILVTIKRFTRGGIASWERWGAWLVFGLAVARAFLWAERLAVLEILVPFVVTSAAFYRFRSVPVARVAMLVPLVGPFFLFLAFAGTEYFRSWRFYQDYYDSIWQFTFERLMTYYAVATNSGIGLLVEARGDWPDYTGRFVFEWAYNMPVLGGMLIDTFGDVRQEFDYFLMGYGDREFNNPSGIFPIVFDVGYLGSALYFLVVGLVVGFARRSYARMHPFGLMFYPFCVLFILELLRFNYLAASRFIPIAGSLAVALYLLHELPRRRHPHKVTAWRKT